MPADESGASDEPVERERRLVEENAYLKERIAQLEQAVESHAAINQAQGILMAVHRMSAEAAWAALQRVSSHTNIKLRLVADAVVDVMSTPDPVLDSQAAAAVLEMLLPSLRDANGQRRDLREDEASPP
jgi:hypothetical protein